MWIREYSRKTKVSSYFIAFTKINSLKTEELNVNRGVGGGENTEGNISELETGKELMKKVTKGYITGIQLTTLFCTIHVLYLQKQLQWKVKKKLNTCNRVVNSVSFINV